MSSITGRREWQRKGCKEMMVFKYGNDDDDDDYVQKVKNCETVCKTLKNVSAELFFN